MRSSTRSASNVTRRALVSFSTAFLTDDTFVDDFLITGDCEESARRGAEEFEALLEELGVCGAPHKQRGPCQCIEFLGLLLCNLPAV